MEEFDLYGDLELLHAEEQQNAIEDLKWKDKYKVALITIEKLQAENKELKKKIKNLETNFASLFDTARTEIKRKDNLISELRKQKDDICFRRSKPQFAGRQFNENSDVDRATSSESVHMNPFTRQPRNTNASNTEISKHFSDEKLPQTSENTKRKHSSNANSRERDSRNVSQERDDSRERDRRRNSSKDRSRHRNRSRDRINERSRHRSNDRYCSKDRDNFREDFKRNTSRDRSNYKKEEKNDNKRKKDGRYTSQTIGSDSSCEKKAKSQGHSLKPEDTKVPSNKYEAQKIEEKPKDVCKSANDQPIPTKTELNQLKNIPSSKSEKQLNSKIEILQVEILKDVKEFKKSKLKDNIPKPEPIDPVAATIEKSNTFLDALFDDSIMNEPKELDDDLYDDLIVPNQQPISKDNLEKDANYNLNYHTPQRQSNTINLLDELFGSSPAASLCTVVTRQDSEKSKSRSANDSDFVLISKSETKEKGKTSQLPTEAQVSLNENCSQTDEKINEEPLKKLLMANLEEKDSNYDKKKSVKIDENFNFKQQTPQKHVGSKLMDDLFGQSPSSSICGKKNSITSVDESSSDFKFESNLNSGNGEVEEKQASSPSKNPIVTDDNFAKSNENIETVEREPSTETNQRKQIINNANTFKFAELDSSFYSSEDELSDNLSEKLNKPEVESPPFENITSLKTIRDIETELNILISGETKSEVKPNILNKAETAARCESSFSNHTNEKTSGPEKHTGSKTSCFSSEKSKERKEINENKEHSIFSKDSMFKSISKENIELSRCSRSEQEKRHRHRHRKPKDNSQESTYTKSASKKHRKHKQHNINGDKIEAKSHNNPDSTLTKNDTSNERSSPLLYFDDDSAKDSLQHQKVTDQDQVFFLHCDNISSDEEVFEKEPHSKDIEDKSCNVDRPNNEENTIDDELKLNEVTNEIPSNQKLTDSFESNDKRTNSSVSSEHENSVAIDMEVQQDVQKKDLIVKEISNPRFEENIFNPVCSSVDFDKKEKHICDTKTNPTTSKRDNISNCLEDVDDQQFSNDNQLESTKTSSEKDKNNKSAQVEAINLDDGDEVHECPKKTDETLVLEKDFNIVQNVCSLKLDKIKESNIHTNDEVPEIIDSKHSLVPTNHHVESSKNLNVLNKEQSSTKEIEEISSFNSFLSKEENDVNFEKKFKSDTNSSKGNFELRSEEETNIEKSPIQSGKEDTLSKNECCKTNSENQNITGGRDPEGNTEKEVSNQIAEQISIATTNDLLSRSHSADSASSYATPQKINNSTDEHESSYSNSELVSTGRRKKIKTPRKRTDNCDCKDASNGTTILVLNRLEKCNDAQTSNCIEPEPNLLSTEVTRNTENLKGNQTEIREACEKNQSYENLNGDLEKENKIRQNLKSESSTQGTISDSHIPNSENNGISSSLPGKKARSTNELTLSSPKSNDITIEPSSKINLSMEQQKEDLEINKESSPDILASSTNNETKFENTKDGCRKLEETRNLHKKNSTINEVEEEPTIDQRNYSDAISEFKEKENKEDELNAKIIETCSITIKRNKNKRKNIKKSVEKVETVPNEVENTKLICGKSLETPPTLDFETEQNKNYHNGNICSPSAASISSNLENEQQMMKHFMDSEYSLVGTCNYPSANYPGEVLETKEKEKTPKKLKLKFKMSIDKPKSKLKKKSTECSSPIYESTKVNAKRKYKKKITQILDSSNSNEDDEVINSIRSEESRVLSNDADKNHEYLPKTLDEPCNFSSVTNLDEVVNRKLTKTNVKKRKVKHETKSEDREAKASERKDLMKSTTKKKYKKIKEISDSSNENIQESKMLSMKNDECEIKKNKNHLNNLESIESFKKRKYKKTHLNSSLDSTDNCVGINMNESSSSLSQLDSSINNEKIDEIPHTSSETTNTKLIKPLRSLSEEKESNHVIAMPLYNNSLPEKEKDDNICNIKHEKTKRHRKRRLSRSSEAKSEDVTVQSKRSKSTLENSQSPRQTPENSVSVALTPTHHKIFLNDVFPNDPPPVYKANDDDLQYHEIDDRLRCMFQSPSYTQPSNMDMELQTNRQSNDLNATNEENVTVEETLNQSENVLVDETLNPDERTNCDVSAGSRKVSLGSNEYVIESIGSHSANVFITRKKSKKRTKVVATSV